MERNDKDGKMEKRDAKGYHKRRQFYDPTNIRK